MSIHAQEQREEQAIHSHIDALYLDGGIEAVTAHLQRMELQVANPSCKEVDELNRGIVYGKILLAGFMEQQ
ncbi:MAG TPA: hypothetical protein VFL85_02845 [Candidatus Saccharimonadales bacterium]|nr:hypothetical protein [Candidatus Saccharimonadales bacterium]